MVPIAVSPGSTDLGPERGGEHFHDLQNFIIVKTAQDWLIDEAHNNTMLQWNKTVTIQNKFAFVTSSYTNQQVGGLTDKDFAYPAGCTKPCATKEELAQFVY